MVCDLADSAEPRRGPGDAARVLMELGGGALPLASGGGGEEGSNEEVDMSPFDFFFLNFPNLPKPCEA